MKIFVTGGNGFIGSQVVRLLLAGGHRVRCLLRDTSKTHRIDGLDCERHIGNLLDVESLMRGMASCDGVIHLAAVSSWTDHRSRVLETVLVDGSRCVFDAARKNGNLRCVFVSSAAAINASRKPIIFDESSPFKLDGTELRYAIAKHNAELLSASYVANGLPVIIVNPVEVYGPNDIDLITACNIRDIIRNNPAIACTGGTAIAHVDDVADGIVKAMLKGKSGERYILGGDNLTIEEIVKLTLRIAGQKKIVITIPNKLLRWTIEALSRIGLPTPVVPEVLDYATRFFFMDSSKAERDLGYRSRPAYEVLEPVVNWLRDERYV